MIIKGTSKEHFSLYPSALSTAKFPKVRRRAQRHSTAAFVRLRSPRGIVPHPEERRQLRRESAIRTFSSRASFETKKSARKNLKTPARPSDFTVHRSTDDKSSDGAFSLYGVSLTEDGFFLGCTTGDGGNLRDFPPRDRTILTYLRRNVWCARNIFETRRCTGENLWRLVKMSHLKIVIFPREIK